MIARALAVLPIKAHAAGRVHIADPDQIDVEDVGPGLQDSSFFPRLSVVQVGILQGPARDIPREASQPIFRRILQMAYEFGPGQLAPIQPAGVVGQAVLIGPAAEELHVDFVDIRFRLESLGHFFFSTASLGVHFIPCPIFPLYAE